MTLAGDACGVKKHKETYGEPTPEKIFRAQAVDKTAYYDEAGQVSDFFLGEFLPFCENYFEKIIFCHNFPFYEKKSP